LRVTSGWDHKPPHGRALVTGCAGFIGSRLAEQLLHDGVGVVGVDCLTDYYDLRVKHANLRRLEGRPGFNLRRIDLSRDPVDGLLNGVHVVYHLAGQPGVRASFACVDECVRHNVEATRALLRAAAQHPIDALVYASSSSVYGEDTVHPTPEHAARRPRSPYGLTKVAVEDLATAYAHKHGVPAIGLRYFSAYGPGQRPDMAFARFIRQLLAGEQITVFGDGRQIREFTYIDDVVQATIAAAIAGEHGAIYNIGGGHPAQLRETWQLLGELLGRRVRVEILPAAPGDVQRTGADGTLAREQLGFTPLVGLHDGLRAQVEASVGRASEKAPRSPGSLMAARPCTRLN
jgi:UDP-glucuronate 4-epimerase